MSDSSPAVTERDSALDGMRIVAMLFVITIHVAAKGFGQFQQHWWAVNAWESVSRIAVPLFFMISGALLLPRRHTIASMGRRLWRIGLPLVGWSCIYLAWFVHTGEHRGNWLIAIVTAPAAPHLWYLYALIGLYVFLPVCAGFYQANPPRVQWFCLLFWLIGASLVPLEIALTGRVSVGISWSFLPLYAGYMAAGALLYHHLPALPRRIAPVWLAWGLLTTATAVATWWRCHTLARPDEAFYVYSSPTVLLAGLAGFVCLRWLFTRAVRPGSRLEAIIAFFSNVSFGVYLLHVLVLFYLDRNGYDYRFVNPWLGIPGLTLAIMLICAPVVRALQKIPGVRLLVPA